MPKPIVNNKIIYQNVYGLVAKHEGFLSQGVREGDSPTFSNLVLTGDGTIRGNLYVEGNTTILNTNVIEFEDNIVLLNRLETGAGVTLNQSGLEIERGTLENYRMVFNDTDDTFRIGLISNMQAVATREDAPLQNGIMIWNDSTKRLDSRSNISIDLTSSSTTNSTSTSSGSFILSGGLGVAKDVWTNGKLYLRGTSHTSHSVIWTNTTTNSLNVSSVGDINITPETKINIPYNRPIVLGEDLQSIVAESGTRNIVITGAGHVDFELVAGKRIRIPNQIPITFSTQSEQIYTDSSNNMVIGSGQNIEFIPGPNKKVVVPLDIGLVFSNNNQQISGNLNNDLTLAAGNNIILNPGPTLDVRIPTDNGIKFGGSGLQRIVADSNDDLFIESASDIKLNATSSINIPVDVELTFGDPSRYIRATGNDVYLRTDNNKFFIETTDTGITSTTDSDNGTTGALWTSGGIGVTKTIYTETGVIVDSDASESVVVRKNSSGQNIFKIDSSSNGKIDIVSGDGSTPNPSVEITTTSVIDAKTLIVLKAGFDNKDGYMIGRGYTGLNSGRSVTVNIPQYSDYSNTGDKPKFTITTNDCTEELFSVETETGNIISKGAFGLSNTQDASNATTASFVVSGGLGVVKTIVTQGDIHTRTESETALDVKDTAENSILRVDTKYDIVNVNGTVVVNNSSGNLLDLGGGKMVVDPLANTTYSTFKQLYANTDDTTDVSNGAVVVSGGVGIAKNLSVGGISYLHTVDMSGTRITNMQNPVDAQDSATKAYVDLVKQGLHVKDSVQVATVTDGNISISYNTGTVVDGYTLKTGDRILLKDQITLSENGVYIVQDVGAPLRAIDFNIGRNVSGSFVFVVNGSLNKALGWICNSEMGLDVVGSDDINFTQFTALGQVEAGDAVSKTFNRIDVNVDNTSLEIVSDQLRIKNTAVGTGMTGGSGSPLQTSTNQSHVTQLGTINTGTWQGSSVQVFYGGTGVTRFTDGNILFGGGLTPIKTDSRFYYDAVNTRLGLGTNQPTKNLHISSITDVSLLLNADSDGVSALSKPEIIFSYSGDVKSYVGLSRGPNEYASSIYSQSLVISHDKLDSTSVIQLATQRQNRLTILSNGNVGINTSNPSARLHVIGTLLTTEINTFRSTVESTSGSNGALVISGGLGVAKASNFGGRLRVYNNTPTTSVNTGAVIIQGGLAVQGNQNAVNVGNGGALTVAGGASIGGDLYIGGSINGSGSSSSTYAYLTLTATDESVNFSSGSLVTFGGITIQATRNSSSVTDGGTILTEGGASIGADIYIGGNNHFYGYTNYYAADSLLNFYDETVTLRFSLDRSSTTGDFSLSRYDVSGTFIERTFSVNSTDGSVLFANNMPSASVTSASFVLTGGLSVGSTQIASSVTSGGGVTVDGGIAVSKNAIIGGDVQIISTTQSTDMSNGSLIVYGGVSVAKDTNIYGNLLVDQEFTTNSALKYNGAGQFSTIVNNSLNPTWYYFGQVNDITSNAFCEVILKNGCTLSNTETYDVRAIVKINNTTCSVSHNYSGSLAYSSIDKASLYVYKDATTGFHLFAKTPASSSVQVNVIGKSGLHFNIVEEGDAINPDGTTSGYTGSWSLVSDTAKESNLRYTFGDVVVEGSNFSSADNFPILGLNNVTTTGSRDLGIAFQRYQSSNDVGTGELVTDQYVFYDSIPNQTSANADQIKFSNLLNATDNYYNGWWIRVASGSNIDQVRKIVSYNGAQRVATLDSAWTSQNPANGDTVYFYNAQYVSFYYDDFSKSFRMVYNTRDPVTKAVTSYDYVDLAVNHVTLSDTTESSSISTGSLTTSGGISIRNTTDASSCTSGGTITTNGGVGIKKRLYVGDNIAVGSSGFTPATSLHIKQTTATVRLENNNNDVSYIDFTESGSGDRFGILSDTLNNQFSLTVTSSGQNPDASRRIFTANSSGYIGINTTSGISSPLTLLSSSVVSADTNSSYIGLVGGSSNENNTTSGGRVIVYGNSAVGSNGNVVLSSGTSGSVRIHTDNDKERLRVSQDGKVSVFATTVTKSATAGALVVSGGVAVTATENASSFSAGGALTVAGGAAIAKDFFVGGNLFITGNLNATGSATAPTITFVNAVNCTLTGYDNNKLLTVSQEAIFSFAVYITPTVEGENCQIEFTAPSRENGFEDRSQFIATCTAYTDDDELIPVFNAICVGVKNENRGIIKFQSVSTGIHYFDIICRYTMA
jgi:hypothetical protein